MNGTENTVSLVDVNQLLARLREGDKLAQGQLIEIILPAIDEVVDNEGEGVEYDAVELLERVVDGLRAGKFKPDGQRELKSLQRWVKTVARNYIRDRRRAGEQIHVSDFRGFFIAGEGGKEDGYGTWTARLVAAFREIHPFVVSKFAGGRGVDLAAVYLFEMRRLLVLVLRRAELTGVPVIDFCESLVPWSHSDAKRCFRPTWPSIDRLWDALSNPIIEGQLLDIDLLLTCARSLEPACDGNAAQYYNWVRRIRKHLAVVLEDPENADPVERAAWEAWRNIFKVD